MNVLILSCNTGQGHNSCAQALKEVFEAHGDSCEIVDALRFISSRVSRFISGWHEGMYRHMPSMFGWGYRRSEKHPAVFDKQSTAHKILTTGTERLYEFLYREQYDVVICTHVFPALMLTDVLKNQPLPLTSALVATDYTCTPSTGESQLDYYFIPDESLISDFVQSGVPKEKLIVSGIPVRQPFLSHRLKEDAKVLLGIRPEQKHLLLMCGSMGCGPITKITRRLMRSLREDMVLTIVCGSNTRLYKRLYKIIPDTQNVRVLAYTDQVALLMDGSDFFLTKPGGISVTEAAAKALPMAFINTVSGCEAYNMAYYVKKGAAVAAKDPAELADLCVKLLYDESIQQKMVAQLKTLPIRHAPEKIYQILSGDQAK